MGLEVTILKVRHTNAQEARKLFLYIRDCDIFCPEDAHGLEEKMRKTEKLLYRLIRDTSREKKRFVDFCYGDAESLAFEKTHMHYALKKGKPIFYLERHSKNQAAYLNRINKEVQKRDFSMNNIVEERMFEHYESYLLHNKYYSYRDRHIANQLENAEEIIRRQFPRLKKKNLHLTMSIGALHFPEKYVTIPTEVIPLTDLMKQEADILSLAKVAEEKSFKKFREYFIENYVRKSLKNNLNTVKDLK